MTDATHRHLCVLSADLNQDELDVLIEVADGLKRGRDAYGPLDIATDRRDFDAEAQDELRDFVVYRAIAALKKRRAERAALLADLDVLAANERGAHVENLHAVAIDAWGKVIVRSPSARPPGGDYVRPRPAPNPPEVNARHREEYERDVEPLRERPRTACTDHAACEPECAFRIEIEGELLDGFNLCMHDNRAQYCPDVGCRKGFAQLGWEDPAGRIHAPQARYSEEHTATAASGNYAGTVTAGPPPSYLIGVDPLAVTGVEDSAPLAVEPEKSIAIAPPVANTEGE